MKKLLLSLTLIFGALFSAEAQVQLTLYTGYQFGSSTNVYSYNNAGRLKLDGSQDFAGMLSFEVREGTHAELSYSYMSTSAKLERAGFVTENLGDVDIHYYQIGGVQESPVSESVVLFGNLAVGGTTFVPKDDVYNSKTYFSVGVGGGVKLWLTDVIGLRLQARLLMPVTWGGFYFGTGGSGASVGSAIVSGDVGGGLVFKLGN